MADLWFQYHCQNGSCNHYFLFMGAHRVSFPCTCMTSMDVRLDIRPWCNRHGHMRIKITCSCSAPTDILAVIIPVSSRDKTANGDSMTSLPAYCCCRPVTLLQCVVFLFLPLLDPGFVIGKLVCCLIVWMYTLAIISPAPASYLFDNVMLMRT